jgi:hypothetical protein
VDHPGAPRQRHRAHRRERLTVGLEHVDHQRQVERPRRLDVRDEHPALQRRLRAEGVGAPVEAALADGDDARPRGPREAHEGGERVVERGGGEA